MVFLALDDVNDLEQHPKATIGVFLGLVLDAAFHGPVILVDTLRAVAGRGCRAQPNDGGLRGLASTPVL